MERIELQDIRVEHFETHEKEFYEFSSSTDPSRSWKLEILEISRLDKQRKPAVENPQAGDARTGRSPFSVLFRNLEPDPIDAQQLHRIRWAEYEAQDVFISRVHVPYLDPRGMYYEIVFS